MGINKATNYAKDVKNLNTNLLAKDYLNLLDLKENNLTGKNIVSIGGGFGVLETYLADKCTLEIVDPVFSLDQEGLQGKIDENIKRIKSQKIQNITTVFNDDLIYALDNGPLEYNRLMDQVQEGTKQIQYNNKLDKIIDSLKQRQNGTILKKIKTNPSSGTNIQGIKENSQDYVIIGHLLSKFSDKEIEEFLNQAKYILKDTGSLLIVDYREDSKYLAEKYSPFLTTLKGSKIAIKIPKSRV